MYKGGDICKQVDGTSLLLTTSTQYSGLLVLPLASTFSIQLVWEEVTTTLASVVTLWASNIDNVNQANDDGWVQMTAGYGFDGFPGLTAGALAADGKDFTDISAAGAYQYRLRFVTTGGTGYVQAHVCIKDSK